VITREEAAIYFRQLIGSKAEWVKLASSQFVGHLSVFVSWCLRDALWRLERLNQEFFISTAINRASILAHVEDREYIPRKRTPASGTARITNNGAASLSLPTHTPFMSPDQREYLTTQAVTITAGTSVDVPIAQMEVEEVTYNIPREEPFHTYLMSIDRSVKLSGLTVELNTDGLGYKPWSYARLFQNAGPYDEVYDEFYSHTGQTGIRFGNGVFGRVPNLNAKLRLTLYLTDGETTLLAAQALSLLADINDAAGQPVTVKAETLTAIENGGDSEGQEEMRANLHYWPIYNEKLVWADDYTFFIRKQIDDIVWAKSWGEEEQESITGFDVHNINRIFITAYAPGNLTLDEEVMAKFATVSLLNRSFTWVEPVFSYFTLQITGKVSRTAIISEVVAAIESALAKDYGRDSKTRKDKVFIKDFYDLVTGTGYFSDRIAYFEITVAGITVATALEEMVSIDINNTEINFSYA